MHVSGMSIDILLNSLASFNQDVYSPGQTMQQCFGNIASAHVFTMLPGFVLCFVAAEKSETFLLRTTMLPRLTSV